MAGIASDRSPGIQISPITSIGTEIPITPAVGDLMDAFRQGFVTVEDIQQRFQGDRLRDDQLKTQLQAGDFQRKLAPGAAQNALAAQGLQADQIQAAQRVLPGATDVTLGGQQAAIDAQRHEAAANSSDEATRLAELQFRETRNYEQLHGHPAPKSFEIDSTNPEPILPFDQWFEENHGSTVDKEANDLKLDDREPEEKINDEVNKFRSDFPLNSKEDNQARAAFENKLRQQVAQHPTADQLRAQFINQKRDALMKSPEVHKEYAKYQQELATQKEKVTPDSPEYLQILQARNLLAQENAAIKAAKIKAIPEATVQRIKLEGEAPLKAAQAQEKAQTDVLTELHKSEAMKRFEPQFEAFGKVDAIKNSGRVPTSADDIATLYNFVKLLDPTSAVREGEVDLAKSTNPYVIQTYNRLSSAFKSNDKIVAATARKELFDTIETLKQGALATAAPEIKRISNIAKDRGVPLDHVFSGPYQTILTTGGVTPPAGGGSKPVGGTQRVVQNGVTFQWNGTEYVPMQ